MGLKFCDSIADNRIAEGKSAEKSILSYLELVYQSADSYQGPSNLCRGNNCFITCSKVMNRSEVDHHKFVVGDFY